MKYKFSGYLIITAILIIFCYSNAFSQIKILFDATKAETAGNADWVIDADTHNISWSTGPAVVGSGNEANPQRIPTPAQSGITTSTAESYWEGALSSWGIDLVKKGYTVETLPYNVAITYNNASNPQDLSNYKVFIIDEPNIQFTATENTAIIQFVQNGGGLFMVCDHTVSDRNNDGWDSPMVWNDLLTTNTVQANPFGISFDLVNISETSTNVATLPTDTLLHGPMGNVTEVMWSNGTTMTLSTTANPTVKGIVYKTGSSTTGTTNVMVARANYGAGRVVAIGDSSPCDDGSGDPNDQLYDGWITDASGNHEKLIINATIWLASSPSGSTVSVSGVSVNPTTLNLVVGGSTAQLTPTILPANATNQNVTWSSNFSNIASVSTTGVVTPVAVGNCIITVTTADGSHTATCAVTVTTSAVSVSSISVNPTTLALIVGGASSQLTKTILPSNATNQNVTWSSNFSNIASVSTTGVVSPVAVGNCVITVTTADGNHTATCNVTVTSNVGVSEVSGSTNFRIYPNPAADIIHLITPGLSSNEIKLKMYNLIGEEMEMPYSFDSDSKISCNISNLKNGLYFISIETNGKQYLKKVSVVKSK
ncbi:MAG: Ig-like domain-containing protein [Bacteroidota bacterium]